MIVALGFCQKDAAATRDLLLWCEQLGGCRDFDCLLVTDPSTQWSECVATMDQASKVFRVVNFEMAAKPVSTWPQGPNALFKAAADWCHKAKQPFLWLESDAIPLKDGWLGALHAEYNRVGNPFMGRVYGPSAGDDPKLPKQLMSGVGIYAASSADLFKHVWKDDSAWDVATASVSVPSCTNTSLIQWFWGQKNLAPTFAMTKTADSPINTFTLEQLEPNAVLFHRNKDGTLIDCLRERAGIHKPTDNFIVVFPFFNGDADNMLKLAEWIAELGTPKTHDALLWFEASTSHQQVVRIAETVSRSFNRVMRGSYREPGLGWNGAWLTAARQMEGLKRPWMWCEPDCVPTTPRWLQALQTRYGQQRKPFIGPVVRDMGHMNGTAIYPWNVPQLCPNTMRMNGGGWAWDMVMKPEMIHLAHDCGDLWQHAWVESNGAFQPHGGGSLPTFPNVKSLSRLQSSAVIFHRNKDLTLIDRLREVRAKP